MDLLIDEYIDESATKNNPMPDIKSSSYHPAGDHIEHDGRNNERMMAGIPSSSSHPAAGHIEHGRKSTDERTMPGIPSSSSHPVADYIEYDQESIDERTMPMTYESQLPGKYNFAHICHLHRYEKNHILTPFTDIGSIDPQPLNHLGAFTYNHPFEESGFFTQEGPPRLGPYQHHSLEDTGSEESVISPAQQQILLVEAAERAGIIPSRQSWDIAIKTMPENQRAAYARYFADYDKFTEYFFKKQNGRLSRLDCTNIAQMKWAIELLEHCDAAGKAMKTSANALTAALGRTTPEFEALKKMIRDNKKFISNWRSQVTRELIRTKFHIVMAEMRHKAINSREKCDALAKKLFVKPKKELPFREQLYKDLKKMQKEALR